MPELRFFCPQCLSTLKLHHAAPEGKRIKCPRCHAISPFPTESAVAVGASGGAKPLTRGVPMRSAPAAIDVEPMDDEEAGPISKVVTKQKKKPFDGVPLFVAFLALAYVGLATATYLGYLDQQIKSIIITAKE